MSDGVWNIDAYFERGIASAEGLVAFYERSDLDADGVGFALVLPSSERRLGKFLRLEVSHAGETIEVVPSRDVRELPEMPMADFVNSLLPGVTGPNVSAIAGLMARRVIGEGYIDVYGYHSPSGGWFICGWLSNDWIAAAEGSIEATAQFENRTFTGEATLNFYEREDLHGIGLGIVLHFASAEKSLGNLLSLTLRAAAAVVDVQPAHSAEAVGNDAIVKNLVGILANSDPGPARTRLQELASRSGYEGHDTVAASLGDDFLLEIDEAIRCPADGIVLMGWMLARPGAVRVLQLRIGDAISPLDLRNGMMWIDRPDVIEAVGRSKGFDDPRCGFVARIASAGAVLENPVLEIEDRSGAVGFKQIPKPKLAGIAAVKRLLSVADLQYNDLDGLYDHLFGPPVRALNQLRLSAAPRVTVTKFGAPIAAPECSIIIPLYGRIDFMEFQIALFAMKEIGARAEIIYVLDDPPRMRETQLLAGSLYERFRVPFKLLCLSNNVGFAPANNVGLRASAGRYICFMNSDVFPMEAGWLGRLKAHLEADPRLGVVGPLLLFEDDSVQHQGITFKKLPQFANWAFPVHRRKGFRRPEVQSLSREIAITGACMLIRREHAEQCGGFDEEFVIGDFEDTDLCLKLRERGYTAAVDYGVSMYHLERKSQASSANLWRNNLTLYNAWIHQRRWGAVIDQLMAQP